MNLQKLKFAIEIEKTSSITQAAKNLYLSQPNLSKSIKELEAEIGIEIFTRTTKGVEATNDGKQFLSHAKSILNQMEILEEIYCTHKEDSFNFKISVPRTTYLSSGFSDFINNINNNLPINIQYRETSNENTINDVISGNCHIGIIRYQKIYETYFLNLLKENNLNYELLWSFKMQILMSKNHPLAKLSDIPYDLLKDYIEIIHGDFQIPNNYREDILPEQSFSTPKNCIYVYDRGTQYDFLQQIKGTYKWASPVPEIELERYDLVQKNCKAADINMDIIIYKNKNDLKPYEIDFIKRAKKIINSELLNFLEN
ncbi:MAG: LysR family transcriptional regulator [Oscillospiraceae bacterium]